MIRLKYDRGSLLIQGEVGTPYGHWDPRVNAYRAMAIHYRDILAYLKRSKLGYVDDVRDVLPCPPLSCDLELRSYQEEALKAWTDADKRGVIVLPTGAGKTYIALEAIHRLNTPTLVLAPTIVLMEQWRQHLSSRFGVEVGEYGGGMEVLKPLTVATYDSAYIRAEYLGNRFLLVIFDEVHHLPAPSFRQIAEMYIAPYRMGLTATYEREDGEHREFPRLVGGLVYRLEVDALAGKHLSPFKHEKIFVNLTPEEHRIYDQQFTIFTSYLQSRGITLRSPEDFRNFIVRTGGDPEAREALLARNRALKTALNSNAKIKILGDLLNKYKDKKILVFTLHNQLVYRISRRFLIPAITYQTSKEERGEILDEFKAGEYRVVVTSQVLDEGIDVPDASVGFILSGTGSSREYIQRLGRILRKVEGKEAKLIEIVAKDTVETRISHRRIKRGSTFAAE